MNGVALLVVAVPASLRASDSRATSVRSVPKANARRETAKPRSRRQPMGTPPRSGAGAVASPPVPIPMGRRAPKPNLNPLWVRSLKANVLPTMNRVQRTMTNPAPPSNRVHGLATNP
jgi:hypothetical protein